MRLLRRPSLRPGATIGIFCPSSPVHVQWHDKYQHGLAQLRKLGFNVVEGELTASGRHQGYRTASPRERAAELMALIRDPNVHGLMSVIGGANASSLIAYLDLDEIRAHPKVVCGYSDVTSLHMAMLTLAGVSSFYGPAVAPSSRTSTAGIRRPCSPSPRACAPRSSRPPTARPA